LACISQAGLKPASGGAGALLFSQCNMAWRSFVWAVGSGCQSSDSSWWFFSAKCGSSISAKFLIYGAHAVCFCPLVTILDPKQKLKQYMTTKPPLQKILQGILHVENERKQNHERTGSTKPQEKKRQKSRE
jgi:hypothetical protein